MAAINQTVGWDLWSRAGRMNDFEEGLESGWAFDLPHSGKRSTTVPRQVVSECETNGTPFVKCRRAFVKGRNRLRTRALFERINQCNYAQSKQTQSEGEDERIVTVKVWGNNGYLELKGEPVYFSLELKRFLLIFDDYVYNYSETKQLILQ